MSVPTSAVPAAGALPAARAGTAWAGLAGLVRIVLEVAGGALLVAESILVLATVFFRYVLNDPLYWAEEAARLLLIWLAFVGGALAFQRRQHIRMDVVVTRLPRPAQDALAALVGVLGILFCGVVAYQGWAVTLSRWTRVSPVMGLPYLVFAVPLVLGLLLSAGFVLSDLVAVVRRAPGPAGSVTAAALAVLSLALVSPGLVVTLAGSISPIGFLFGVFALTLCMNMPIAFSLGLTALGYLGFYGGMPLSVVPQRMLAGVDAFILLAVPLFIVGGALMEVAGISQRIVDLAMVAVGRMRGGMGQVTVVTEILFSGISGSATADVAAVGSLLIPSMKRTGYSPAESASIVCAAAAMGILIPPSVHMIVLGTLVNVSVAKLFVAGFLPAFVMAAGLMVLIAVKARRQNWPRAAERLSGRQVGRALLRAIIPLMTPVIIFGGIFTGATTITESAVLAVAYSVVVGILVYREMSWGRAWRLFVDGASTSGVALLLVATATVFGWSLVTQRIPHLIAEWMTSLSTEPWVFLTLTVALYLVFSDLLEGLPALVIFAPILYPIAEQLHVDPVHFGIVSVAALGLGFFLPPAALGLSLACSMAGTSMGETVRVFWVYVLVLLAGLLVVAYVPSITLLVLKWVALQ